jgi:hypothetical protein
VIEGYSIDSLNAANLRRRLDRDFVVQEAGHTALLDGEDLKITMEILRILPGRPRFQALSTLNSFAHWDVPATVRAPVGSGGDALVQHWAALVRGPSHVEGVYCPALDFAPQDREECSFGHACGRTKENPITPIPSRAWTV